MTGNVIPESPKPVPLADAPLRVSAAVPEDVSVTVFVTVVFSAAVPKATLLLPSVSFGVVAFRVSAKELTAVAIAVNAALVDPEAIVTEAGTVTALLLLAKVTVVAVVAADVSVTVQASVPAPVSDPLLQESALNVDAVCPVPLRVTVAVDALLLIVTAPVNEPAAVGSKLIVSVAV